MCSRRRGQVYASPPELESTVVKKESVGVVEDVVGGRRGRAKVMMSSVSGLPYSELKSRRLAACAGWKDVEGVREDGSRGRGRWDPGYTHAVVAGVPVVAAAAVAAVVVAVVAAAVVVAAMVGADVAARTRRVDEGEERV